MVASAGEVTQLLHEWQGGSRNAESKLFELMMPDLRRIAAQCFRRERSGHTLQPTALVNEAFLRLEALRVIEWRDRGHFLALAARLMRRYLIDYARAHPEADFEPLGPLADETFGGYTSLGLATALDFLLEELETESPQRRKVVELKFFLGLTDSEAAEALNLTLHTCQREWYRARKWLFERLSATPAGSPQ